MNETAAYRRFTREELYELAWSAPLKAIAPTHDIAAVTFAQICRGAAIPLPPPGYWTKIQTGRKVSKEPLPLRGIGISQFIELGTRVDQWGHHGEPPDLNNREIPPMPEFAEPISGVRARVTASVGAVPIPSDFTRAHRLIAGFLADDEARRRKLRDPNSFRRWDVPRFESPFEQRRLRFLNALFLAVEKAGHRPWIRGKDSNEFGVGVGGQRVVFTLDHPGQQRYGYRLASPVHRPASDKLRLEISPWRKSDELRLVWEDKKDDFVEHHVARIVVTLIVAGEVQCRRGEIERIEWLTERKAQLIGAARTREEEEERRIRERRLEAEQARVDRLLGEAEAFRKSQTIRTYVEMVRARNAVAPEPVSVETIDAWARWALARADRLDPVVTKRFLSREAENGADAE